jgi:hypothetical protein
MCFSAEASFGAGILLTGIGIATLKKTKLKKQLPFASIPILFALQQFTEGLLWISTSDPVYSGWRMPMTYLFLLFALAIWPIWVSFSVTLIEKDELRKKALIAVSIFGLLLSVFLSYCLASYPVVSFIESCHIYYHIDFPFYTLWIGSIAYLIPTVFSLFISSVKGMRNLAVAIFLAYIFTKIFYSEFIVSVWCFFAAILSILIYNIIKQLNTKKNIKIAEAIFFIKR